MSKHITVLSGILSATMRVDKVQQPEVMLVNLTKSNCKWKMPDQENTYCMIPFVWCSDLAKVLSLWENKEVMTRRKCKMTFGVLEILSLNLGPILFELYAEDICVFVMYGELQKKKNMILSDGNNTN